MKKFTALLLVGTFMLSCEKVQQTTDTIKSADSLITKANDGIKTLDSISKTINSSEGITKKVIIPEIEKQKKSIDSTIKSGGWRIDSINKQIEKITKNVAVGTDVAKTLDSANTSLQNGENALKVLTRTADKLLKQTKKYSESAPTPPPAQNDPVVSQSEPSVSQNEPAYSAPTIERNPIVKTARFEIQVENLDEAKALLRQKIRENNADLVTENFSQNEGIQKEYITAKVPLQHFDQLVSGISSQLGDVKLKSTESEGSDYIASQMCDVEIVLLQNENIAGTGISKDENGEEKADGFSGAFLKGFKLLGDAMMFLLPFWPVFLIAGAIWYFVTRNRRKKLQHDLERQQQYAQQNQYPTENQTSMPVSPPTEETKIDENDYSKYMPK